MDNETFWGMVGFAVILVVMNIEDWILAWRSKPSRKEEADD